MDSWGEASEDVHNLVQTLASQRLKMKEIQGGDRIRYRKIEGELASLVGYVRRKISITTIRAQARCLLDRMETYREGKGASVDRRRMARLREDRWRRERSAQLIAERQGRGIMNRGHFKLN